MKFMRRPELDPQTRIQLVMTACCIKASTGKMTKNRKILSDIPHLSLSTTFYGQLSGWKRCLAMKTLFQKIIVT